MLLSSLVAAARPAQIDVTVDTAAGIDPLVGLVGGAIGAFVTTLAVGAILVAIAPAYTERMMVAVTGDVAGSFLTGIFWLLVLLVVSVALVVSIVGILVVVPLLVLAVLVWAVGAAIAYLAIAERLVGRDAGWTKPLVVAAALNGALALSGVGGIVSFCVGATGFGAVLRDWRS